jgi:transcription initiation factor TFIIA small subunit
MIIARSSLPLPQDSLQELIECGAIPQSLAHTVLLQFDKTVNEALSTRAKNRVVFHSEKLSTYRFCDNVWTFLLKVERRPNVL